MIKKTITYEDYDGNPVTEDFHFNLSKAELAEMELAHKGGFKKYIESIIATEDGKKLVAVFKDLLVLTVGRKSEDGRRFIKSQEIIDDFTQTNAYSEMFIELATNAEQAAVFINGVAPESLRKELEGVPIQDVELPFGKGADTNDMSDEPAWITENREPTDSEIRNATPEQLRLAMARKISAKSSPELA